mmetsp:Transcript_59823/g.165453  ORF Transcript_59823/g.165453 Transcript_59823/m.165453 type:complete len:148 (+) Transcript_59823:1755-2198(+)
MIVALPSRLQAQPTHLTLKTLPQESARMNLVLLFFLNKMVAVQSRTRAANASRQPVQRKTIPWASLMKVLSWQAQLLVSLSGCLVLTAPGSTDRATKPELVVHTLALPRARELDSAPSWVDTMVSGRDLRSAQVQAHGYPLHKILSA